MINLTDQTENPLVQEVMDKYLKEPKLIFKPSAEFFRDKLASMKREDRIRLVRSNPILFAEYYLRPLNRLWNTDAEDYQYLLVQAVLENAKTVVHIPIEHGKSTWISEVMPLWFLINDRNLRLALFSRTARQAERFGRTLMHHIEHNHLLKEDFGDYLKPSSEKWTQSEGFVERDPDRRTKDPTFQFLGVGGAVNGARLDIIICDDILDLTNSQSPVTRDGVEAWFLEMVLSRLVEGGRCMLVGTLQSRLDLLCTLSDKPGFHYVHIKAVDEDNQTTLSRRWPYERLMTKKSDVGTVKFMKLFQNDRNAQTGKMLKPEWLNYYGKGQGSAYPVTLPPYQHMSIYIAIDPAIADKDWAAKLEKNDPDYFALCVAGWHAPSKRLFIIENFKDRLSLVEQLRTIQAYYERYRPIKVGIESVAYQKALAQASWALNDMIPVQEIKTHSGSGSKISRIEALGGHFETKRIWVSPENSNLLDEYLSYPDVTHDDVLDSVELMTRLIQDMPQQQITKTEADLLRSITW